MSTDEDAMSAHAATFDYILSTIPPEVKNMAMAGSRISIGGSMIGSIEETQEVLDSCADHGIASEVEIIPIDRINEAMDAVVAEKSATYHRRRIDLGGGAALGIRTFPGSVRRDARARREAR